MSVFIAGGTGFIGRRLTRSLVGLGKSVTVMDIAPQDGDFGDLGDKYASSAAISRSSTT